MEYQNDEDFVPNGSGYVMDEAELEAMLYAQVYADALGEETTNEHYTTAFSSQSNFSFCVTPLVERHQQRCDSDTEPCVKEDVLFTRSEGRGVKREPPSPTRNVKTEPFSDDYNIDVSYSPRFALVKQELDFEETVFGTMGNFGPEDISIKTENGEDYCDTDTVTKVEQDVHCVEVSDSSQSTRSKKKQKASKKKSPTSKAEKIRKLKSTLKSNSEGKMGQQFDLEAELGMTTSPASATQKRVANSDSSDSSEIDPITVKPRKKDNGKKASKKTSASAIETANKLSTPGLGTIRLDRLKTPTRNYKRSLSRILISHSSSQKRKEIAVVASNSSDSEEDSETTTTNSNTENTSSASIGSARRIFSQTTLPEKNADISTSDGSEDEQEEASVRNNIPDFDYDSSSSDSELLYSTLGEGSQPRSMDLDLDLAWNVNKSDSKVIKTVAKDATAKANQVSKKEKWHLDAADMSRSSATVSRYYALKQVRCHNCNKEGHLSKVCPEPRKRPNCFLCGLHHSGTGRYCPNRLCFNCFQPGHTGDKCRQERRDKFVVCSRCRMKGHREQECPDHWKQYHATLPTSSSIVKMEKNVNPRVYCCVCAQKGHFAFQCRGRRMDQFVFPSYPFIIKYDAKCAPGMTLSVGRYRTFDSDSDQESTVLPLRPTPAHSRYTFHAPTVPNTPIVSKPTPEVSKSNPKVSETTPKVSKTTPKVSKSTPKVSTSAPKFVTPTPVPKTPAEVQSVPDADKAAVSGNKQKKRDRKSAVEHETTKDIDTPSSSRKRKERLDSAVDSETKKKKDKKKDKKRHSDVGMDEGTKSKQKKRDRKSAVEHETMKDIDTPSSSRKRKERLDSAVDSETKKKKDKKRHSDVGMDEGTKSKKPKSKKVETFISLNSVVPEQPSQLSASKKQRYFISHDAYQSQPSDVQTSGVKSGFTAKFQLDLPMGFNLGAEDNSANKSASAKVAAIAKQRERTERLQKALAEDLKKKLDQFGNTSAPKSLKRAEKSQNMKRPSENFNEKLDKYSKLGKKAKSLKRANENASGEERNQQQEDVHEEKAAYDQNHRTQDGNSQNTLSPYAQQFLKTGVPPQRADPRPKKAGRERQRDGGFTEEDGKTLQGILDRFNNNGKSLTNDDGKVLEDILQRLTYKGKQKGKQQRENILSTGVADNKKDKGLSKRKALRIVRKLKKKLKQQIRKEKKMEQGNTSMDSSQSSTNSSRTSADNYQTSMGKSLERFQSPNSTVQSSFSNRAERSVSKKLARSQFSSNKEYQQGKRELRQQQQQKERPYRSQWNYRSSQEFDHRYEEEDQQRSNNKNKHRFAYPRGKNPTEFGLQNVNSGRNDDDDDDFFPRKSEDSDSTTATPNKGQRSGFTKSRGGFRASPSTQWFLRGCRKSQQ